MATPHGESGTGSRQPTVKISKEHYVPETRYNLQLTREERGGFVGGKEKYFALHIDFVSAQKPQKERGCTQYATLSKSLSNPTTAACLVSFLATLEALHCE